MLFFQLTCTCGLQANLPDSGHTLTGYATAMMRIRALAVSFSVLEVLVPVTAPHLPAIGEA